MSHATTMSSARKGASLKQRGPIARRSFGAAFTSDQELEPFGHWFGRPLWVPPKGKSADLARTMLATRFWPRSAGRCWPDVVSKHRAEFTQVREIELHKASIRLSKGRLLVAVTEQDRFDTITDNVPDCVRTRLEEFLDGPGKRPGVKVSYLELMSPLEETEVIRHYAIEQVLTSEEFERLVARAAGTLPLVRDVFSRLRVRRGNPGCARRAAQARAL